MPQNKNTKSDYSKYLSDPRWQKLRLEVYNRDNWKCTLCGDYVTTLDVHHTIYKGKPWEVPIEHLKTVCRHCHKATHALPNHTITSIDKHLAEYCFVMTVFTETEIIFLYLFTKDEIIDIITVFQK